ncbi:MAG: sugar ABC transporter permease, partial [Clostridia bacterium]|nr:sugar ABC transporter permease [Clostridia bacterium]
MALSGEDKKRRKFSFRTYPSVNPWLAFLGTVPVLVSIIVFGVLPASLTIVMSFTDYDGNWATADFVGLKNYFNFFTVLKTDVFSYLWTTLKYALFTILPLQILAVSAALLVNKNFFGRSFFRSLFFMPN